MTMNRNKLLLAICFFVSFVSVAKAEQSATGYSNPGSYADQQVFVVAYNNSASSIARDNVVVLDTTATAGTTLGTFINTTTTTDSVYIFGVTDEAIASGTVGRVCVRGPHKVVYANAGPTAGDTIGTCTNNAGKACSVTTASGTDRGILGKILNTTATTGTGDASNTFWAWIQPISVN